MADDDPWLAAGRKALSGDSETKAPAADAKDDPWLAAGRHVLAAETKADPKTSDKAGKDDAYDISHAMIQIPALHNFAAGATQGARDVVATGLHFANWVNERVPALKWLDRQNPLIGDAGEKAAAFDAARKAYEASPEGQSYTGQAGRIGGEIAMTAGPVGKVAEGVGAGFNALVPTASAAVPWVARTAANVGSWAARTAAEGASAGGIFGALVSGGSDKPAGETIKENVELGAELGPAASLVGKVVGAGARGVGGIYDYVSGRGAAKTVEQAIAEAEARAAAGGGGGAPPGGGGGGGGAPQPAQPTPAATVAPPSATVTPAPAVQAPTLEWRRLQPGETPAPGQQVAYAGDGSTLVREPGPIGGGAAATTPTTATGGAQPAGAQVTPAGAIPAPTRSAEIAGKLRAVDQIISDRPNVNTPDFNEYVKGNLPTKPEGLGDANLAGIQRQIEADNPNYARFRENAKANRIEHFEKRSGIPEQLDELEKDIAKWDQETLDPVWHNKRPVDASGVETFVQNRLNSPAAQIGPVEDALKEVEKRLYKRGGNQALQDDPEMLYGARRQISYMLSRAGRQANPAYGSDDVMRELIGVRDQIDAAIEPGAPGFKAWVTEHAAKMRDVDRMDVLQAMRQKLFAGGEITQGKLAAALKALRTSMNSSGAHPAHSLTVEDLEMLRDLNKDLLREGNKGLSRPLGSPTSRNDQILVEHGLNMLTDVAGRIPGGRTAASEAMGRIARRNAAREKALFEREFLTQPGSTNPLTPP